jgi:DNA-binding beta-propeller fold protein YncE
MWHGDCLEWAAPPQKGAAMPSVHLYYFPMGAVLCALPASGCRAADAQSVPIHWAISSNDNKTYLNDGVETVVANPPPDSISLIDLTASPLVIAAELPVPGSVTGPPTSVAVTPTESLALVTSALKVDPADATKTTPDNRLTVIDLTANPPHVIATLQAGQQPSGVAISRDGKLALVANRAEGSVSIFSISGNVVTPAGKVILSDPANMAQKPQTACVAISPDGRFALATNDGDHRISLLTISGTTVTVTRTFYAGLRPFSVDIAPNGKFAIVSNLGFGVGDLDTIGLVDLDSQPPRVVDTMTVGINPEGVKISPDSTVAAIVVQNGTNKPSSFPFHADQGKLLMVRVDGKTLKKVAESPMGRWGQGAAFTPDGRQLLVGAMVEKEIEIFQWNGSALSDTGTRIHPSGGPVAIRTAER